MFIVTPRGAAWSGRMSPLVDLTLMEPTPVSPTRALEFIGSRVLQSLERVPWVSAWISVELIGAGVGRRRQAYRPDPDAPEQDFRLIDPIGVLTAVETLRNEMVEHGLPRWTGLVMRIRPPGDYEFEYRYPDSGPSRLVQS